MLVCYANRSFAAGEQFTMHYGDRTNAELFLHAGFVTQDNPSASVLLRLGVSKTDPLFEAKTSALRALHVDLSGGAGHGSPCAVLPGDDPISESLWSFAVVFCAGESLLSSLESSEQPAGVVEDVLQGRAHADVRVSATTFLRARLSLLLHAYEAVLPGQSPAEEATGEEERSVANLVTALLQSERGLLQAAATHLDTLTSAGSVTSAAPATIAGGPVATIGMVDDRGQ